MTWHAALSLDYRLEAERSVVRHVHEGPLRVLKSLYPEGDGICHNVLVHPPGGLVGGDTLDIQVAVDSGAHALITTAGATRFYRSSGEPAVQRTRLRLQAGARMEWLPLEAILYNGCQAENHLSFELAPGAELMAWDVTALGLPHADLPFVSGCFCQHIEMPGVWLERGVIDAADQCLLNSPLGLSGQRCMASLFFATGSAMDRPRRELALDSARQVLQAHALNASAGVTCPNPRLVVLRVLAPQVEMAMDLLKEIWAVWRDVLWDQRAVPPRIWAM
ncbi:MAG: urease accessory protein UreD [Gammaproteobacteria bacterium]|uniref:urease accessory protein UreD n=1 Tax=Rhodoferax sp. TaxID=50421 RepID=UPI00181F5AD3|nr:urease accessory protein UreD [Rhodoferax sp.]MBU3900001.1 urease accessory protein UreD [Gammaproteobacteria bacterium]MBA3059904.1 urease accessory protein UreD [Rhodoferax sp.]MBU3997545.1 urease accessory protein UreD [Gammaproteobacteria bacterium]MBU4017577.1 urease accessory protein UreD [Gammaproteobacteria bacterium]MBU4081802.1 urease accessory protein UreD [Gammaproteobacteria bacterium]